MLPQNVFTNFNSIRSNKWILSAKIVFVWILFMGVLFPKKITPKVKESKNENTESENLLAKESCRVK